MLTLFLGWLALVILVGGGAAALIYVIAGSEGEPAARRLPLVTDDQIDAAEAASRRARARAGEDQAHGEIRVSAERWTR